MISSKKLDRPNVFRTSLLAYKAPLRKKMICLCSEQLLDRPTVQANKIKENRKNNNHDSPF